MLKRKKSNVKTEQDKLNDLSIHKVKVDLERMQALRGKISDLAESLKDNIQKLECLYGYYSSSEISYMNNRLSDIEDRHKDCIVKFDYHYCSEEYTLFNDEFKEFRKFLNKINHRIGVHLDYISSDYNLG